MGGILSHPIVGIATSWFLVLAVVAGFAYQGGALDNLITRGKQYLRPTSQPVEEETVEKVARKRKGRNTKGNPNAETSRFVDGSSINTNAEGTSASTSATEVQTTRKRKIAGPTSDIADTPSAQGQSLSRDGESDMSDKDMARKLQQAQKGTNFKGSANNNTGKSGRTSKLSVVETEPPGMSTETSSAGRDGDDDMSSPTESPALEPASTAATSRVGDPVSDMLEPTPEGPKSLRIIPSEGWETQNSKQNSKQKKSATKQPDVQETKRQRQQRRKREEQALEVKRTAEEHKRKGEQQMRTSRMAEGTSKESKATTFQQSVWTGGNKTQENALESPPASEATQVVLDTFEPTSSAQEASEGGVTVKPLAAITNQTTNGNVNGLRTDHGAAKTSALGASKRESGVKPESSGGSQVDDQYTNEQMRSIQKEQDQASSWETVGSKKERKKARKDTDTGSDASGLREQTTRRANGQVRKPAVNGNTQSKSKVNTNPYTQLGLEGGWGPATAEDDNWAA